MAESIAVTVSFQEYKKNTPSVSKIIPIGLIQDIRAVTKGPNGVTATLTEIKIRDKKCWDTTLYVTETPTAINDLMNAALV
jgi:hypothetical protein